MPTNPSKVLNYSAKISPQRYDRLDMFRVQLLFHPGNIVTISFQHVILFFVWSSD